MIDKITKTFIAILTTFFCGLISFFGLFYYLHVDFHTDVQDRFLVSRNPIVAILMVAVALVLVLGLGYSLHALFTGWTEKKQWRVTYTIIGVVALWIGVVSIWWIGFNEFKPLYDQQDVMDCARTIVNGDLKNFNFFYINQYPHQRGFILFLVVLGKLFGQMLVPMRLVNMVSALLFLLALCWISKMIYHNPLISALTAILLGCFCPLWIYVTYIYGTLVAPCLMTCGFGIFLYGFERKDKFRIIAPFLIGLLLFIAISFYKAAMIGMLSILAVSLFCFLFKKEDRMYGLLCMVVVILFWVGGNQLLNRTFDRMVDGKVGRGQPSVAWVCMGLSSNGVWGPGSYDTYTIELYRECEADYDRMKRLATERLKEIVGEYLSGERSPDFFVEKMKYQWLDPNFGAMKTNVNLDENGENTERYVRFYNSSIRDYEEKIMRTFCNLIFLLAVIGAVWKGRREENVRFFLCEIYFIGGFIFQFIWESQARYCFPYFMLLFPLAACGCNALVQYIRSKMS